MSRLAEIATPILLSVAVVWFVYHYIRLNLSAIYESRIAPRICFEPDFRIEHTTFPDGHFSGEYSYIAVRNSGKLILEKCSVKVEAISTDMGRDEIQSPLIASFVLGPDERRIIPLTSHRANSAHTIGRVFLETNSRIELPCASTYKIEIIAFAESGQADRSTVSINIDESGQVTGV